MDLKTYLDSLTADERKSLAEACETSPGHLKNISFGYRSCAEKLAILLERETRGAVKCEELRPDVDWAYLRNSAVHTEEARS